MLGSLTPLDLLTHPDFGPGFAWVIASLIRFCAGVGGDARLLCSMVLGKHTAIHPGGLVGPSIQRLSPRWKLLPEFHLGHTLK